MDLTFYNIVTRMIIHLVFRHEGHDALVRVVLHLGVGPEHLEMADHAEPKVEEEGWNWD